MSNSMSLILKDLKKLNNELTWNADYIQEEISEIEMQELYKLSKSLENKFQHSRNKESLVGVFKSKNQAYIKHLDEERKSSKYIAKTVNGQPILYARFDESYKIIPSDTRKEYLTPHSQASS